VHLVDTPGFNDTELDDEDVFDLLITWLKEFHNKGQKFSGLIYLHPINKTREKGSDVRSLRIFKRLVGRENYNNIVIGLTFSDLEDPEIAASRERTLRESPDFWADMVAAGAVVTRIPFDKDECISLIAKMAGQRRMFLQTERELFIEKKSVAELSATKEFQDNEQLRTLRLREEMQQATQKTLFDERIRLTSQFSTERAALEQKLFQEQQEKQALEEELLMWKDACEKGKEEARALKLQHDREDELRNQKTETEKRAKEAEDERKKNEKVQKEIEERKDIDHAEIQIAKRLAYDKSKTEVFLKYAKSSSSIIQLYKTRRLAKCGNVFTIGICCIICWSAIPSDEPMQCMLTYRLSPTSGRSNKSETYCSED
jgi:hypothetical protein